MINFREYLLRVSEQQANKIMSHTEKDIRLKEPVELTILINY
jgi:hypothetical protein